MGNEMSGIEANYDLGANCLNKGECQTAFNYFKTGAEQGSGRSQAALGELYLMGRGVDQDDKQAALWFQRAADNGIATAQYHYGRMLQLGVGVDQDGVKSAEYFLLAAEDGNAKAQVEYGILCETGAYGVEQNNEAAKEWFERACDQGYLPGRENLLRLTGKAPFQASIDMIQEHLYLGDLASAQDEDTLKKLSITHNLCLCERIQPDVSASNTKIILFNEQDNIIDQLKTCYEYVESSIEQGGTVLVNCQDGVDTSAAVVVVYLMLSERWTLVEALDYVRTRRAINIRDSLITPMSKIVASGPDMWTILYTLFIK